MKWPFGKEKLRTRASLGDLHTQRQLKQYQGLLNDLLAGPAAIARQLYANGLSDCSIEGDYASWFRPTMLSEIGSAIIENGEAVYYIDTDSHTFVPVNGFDVRGGWLESDLSYSLELSGPTLSRTVYAPSSRVIHVRANVDSKNPWRGRSPLTLAQTTAQLSNYLEARAAQGATTPEGNLISYPDVEFGVNEDGEAMESELQTDIDAMEGGNFLVPSGRDAGVAPSASIGSDWSPKRLGYMPSAPLIELRRDAERTLLNACGISPALHDSNSGGTSFKSAMQGFQRMTIQPYANLIAREVSLKTGSDHTISAAHLSRDTSTIGRTLKGLIDAGLTLQQALAISEITAA